MKRTLWLIKEWQGDRYCFLKGMNQRLYTWKWIENEPASDLCHWATWDSFSVKFSENSRLLTDVTMVYVKFQITSLIFHYSHFHFMPYQIPLVHLPSHVFSLQALARTVFILCHFLEWPCTPNPTFICFPNAHSFFNHPFKCYCSQ